MAFGKIFLLLALIPLVVAIVKKGEEMDKQLESISEDTPEIRRSPLARIMATLNKAEARIVHLEARIKRLEARRLLELRGRDGRDGSSGKPGKDGRDGRDGQPGPRGPRGFKGARGSNGARGPRGLSGGGVQYIRWGKTSCPSGSSLVYKGIMGGSHYTHRGGGGNYVCLTENPRYGKYRDGFQGGAIMYSVEYEISYIRNLFSHNNLHDHDAPCAVCYTPSRGAKMMIPATNECPTGWRKEYWGYLMSEYYNHPHTTQFICVDKDAEAIPGSSRNVNGGLLYPVQGTCHGSLPCNKYKQGRELTCAVCTK